MKSPLPKVLPIQSLPGHSITLEHVTFSYDGQKDALSDLSLSIPSGQVAALVGPSGGGKTTLAGIAARFFDPQKGRVLIGDVDIRQISKEDLMNQVSFVFQNSRLIKASILENVRMARPDASGRRYFRHWKPPSVWISSKSFRTALTRSSVRTASTCPGGEQQRIAIARAILKNAPVLILDEA